MHIYLPAAQHYTQATKVVNSGNSYYSRRNAYNMHFNGLEIAQWEIPSQVCLPTPCSTLSAYSLERDPGSESEQTGQSTGERICMDG